MKTGILILLSQLILPACFAQSNSVFSNVVNWIQLQTDLPPDNSQTNKEVLDEAMFPEGNWGEEVGGLRISLRFDKKIYKPGEPMIATMLIRNTTDHPVGYQLTYPVPYSITNVQTDGEVKGEPYAFLDGSTKFGQLPVKGQIRWQEHFSEKHGLTNGTYLISVALDVPREKGKSINKMYSGTATVRIVSSDGAR